MDQYCFSGPCSEVTSKQHSTFHTCTTLDFRSFFLPNVDSLFMHSYICYHSIGDFKALLFDLLHLNIGQVVMLLSCLFTFFLNYIVVLNTTINSALTQAICGNLKVSFFACFSHAKRTEGSINIYGITWPILFYQDVFTSGIGWMIFGGLPYDLVKANFFEIFNSWLVLHLHYYYLFDVNFCFLFCWQFNVLGQSLGFLGSCLYAYCKLQGIWRWQILLRNFI